MHQPTGKLIDDDDLALHDDIILLPLKGHMCPKRLLQHMRPFHIRAGKERTNAGDLLSRANPLMGQMHGLAILLDLVILRHRFECRLVSVHFGLCFVNDLLGFFHTGAVFGLFGFGQFALRIGHRSLSGINGFLQVCIGSLQRHQLPAHRIGLLVSCHIILRRAGNNQRRPRLIDQDRVHLIDNRILQRPLSHLRHRGLHIIAQVVKSEFIIGTIGDIAAVLRPPLGTSGIHIRLNRTNGHPQCVVHRTHPLSIALGKVVIDGDQMHLAAGQMDQICRQRRHQRLALTGGHLGDFALEQHMPANQLNIIVPHVQIPSGRFPHNREGLGQDMFRVGVIFQRFLKRSGSGLELLIAQGLGPILQFTGRQSHLHIRFNDPLVTRTKHPHQKLIKCLYDHMLSF